MTLPARLLSPGLWVTGSPSACPAAHVLLPAQSWRNVLCGWRGTLPHLSPATRDHPGMASPLTTESEPISRSSPPPSACSKWARPSPGPFYAHCGFALDAAREHCPRAPVPALLLLPEAIRIPGSLCPSGTLGHTLYRLPCPHTKSLSGQLTFVYS